MLMITFLTLQCNLLWNDVMQAVVFSAEHISILMWSSSGSFIGGQEVDSGVSEPGFTFRSSPCLLNVKQGSYRKPLILCLLLHLRG